MSLRETVHNNYAVAAGVGVGWWAILLARDVARYGLSPQTLNLNSSALVYLLLLLVQGLLFLLARVRLITAVRVLIGVFGALLLYNWIFASSLRYGLGLAMQKAQSGGVR